MLARYFQHRRDIKALQRAGLFAEAWYRRRYLADRLGVDTIGHYVRHGAALGHDPHPRFDARWYLSHNTDVRAAGIDPFVHYASSGRAEGRAPHPWGRAAWAPEAPALIDHMRDRLGRGSTGAIDMLTPDFVAGWVSCATRSPDLVVAIDGAELPVRNFETRPDLGGRPAFAFVLQFPRRLAPGSAVRVGFAGGEALLGSPTRVRDARPSPATAARALVTIDTPGDTLTRRIVDIVGWIGLPDGEGAIDVTIDGEGRRVAFRPRADVIALRGSSTCVGFAVRLDAAAAAAKGRRSVELAIAVDGHRVAARSYALALEPLPRPRAPLLLFMHIPKTAGVSLVAAIDGVPDPRALWLYDDEHGAIADKLALLSPHAFDDLRVVGGHFAHGIAHAIARPARYFTVLREPTSFLRSFFFYCKYVRRHERLRDLDIHEALESRAEPYLDNAFTRHFARVPCDRAVVASDLVRALGVMERDFDFVGFVEDMEESVARISRLLGIAIPVRVENATPPTAESQALDLADFARRARHYVRFDEILVARARGKWWTASEPARAAPSRPAGASPRPEGLRPPPSRRPRPRPWSALPW